MHELDSNSLRAQSSTQPCAANAPRPTLALSTCWCSARHTDGYAMLREIAEMGFTHVELSHGIRITLVPGILRALEEQVIQVSSTHNFCPLPTGFSLPAPNAFEPSVRNATHHDQWLRQTRRSLDFAAEIGARALVMHLGSVRKGWFDPVKKFLAEAERCFAAKASGNFANEPTLVALREKMLKKLRARVTPHWERVCASVEEIREYARERGVTLGFENRERPEELPFDDQFEALFSRIAQPNTVGYWHDTGHAHIKAQLGLLNHSEHLQHYASRLIGFHLHDVTPHGSDHQPIGEGEIDFEMVKNFWRPEHILVLELAPSVSVDAVRISKNKIEKLLGH